MGVEYFVNPQTGSVNPVNGKKGTNGRKPTIHTKKLKAGMTKNLALPSSVDLRQYMTPVEEQGTKMNSCVANALAGAVEYLMLRESGVHIDVSRLFIFYNSRIIEEKTRHIDNTGVTIESGIKAIQKFGVCRESTWPYDPRLVNQEPSQKAFDEARRITIEPLQVQMDLDTMRECLAMGYPFCFGLKLFSSFQTVELNQGYIPMPEVTERLLNKKGYHAVLAVGYDDEEQHFIIRNSWGRKWGDQGYGYIPYSYMTNFQLVDPTDVFAITQVTQRPLHERPWPKTNRHQPLYPAHRFYPVQRYPVHAMFPIFPRVGFPILPYRI
ncbi:unnamed protein product [Didymodactylos carnosus]|uniref:Peptidase C1A papain C-terminal domain-containing protein n=1 Tax=Didymodactylos carnosus TaxID=1234261 RepID=A0A815W9N5_9BILA|nr:unnamed protein product [Didymodactylos carnosus]CAF1545758.1 unnamed protein product [Didymodactylos carnosus]CAF4207022.1 unnamed protein product [Didymodactylos carnosus]CAF4406527.1 unnamed protein product [Didymodactylos carnosus]